MLKVTWYQKKLKLKNSKFLFNSIYSLAGLLIYQLSTALSIIIIARKVLPLFYAQYVSITAFLSITVVIANFGFDTWFLSPARGVPDLKNLWINLFFKKIKNLFFWMLIIFIVSFLFLNKDEYPTLLVFLLLISFFIENLTQTIFSLLRVLKKYHYLFIVQSVFSVFYIFLVVLIPQSEYGIIFFSIIKILISALIFSVCIMFLKKLKIVFFNTAIKKYSINTIPFLIADISAKIYSRVDLFLLSIFIGNSATSVYAPALSMITFSFLIPSSFNFVVLPWLSNQFLSNRENNPTSSSFFKKSLFQLFVQIINGIILFSFFYFFSEIIILLTFGENYTQAGQYLRYLSIIPFFKSINFGLGAIITSSGNQIRRTKAMVVVAGLNLFGNLIFVNLYEIWGAVIVYVFSEMALVCFYLHLLKKGVD